MIDSFRRGGKEKDNVLWVKVKSFPEWPARVSDPFFSFIFTKH